MYIFFVVKEGSSDYNKVIKRCSLTEWFFDGIAVRNIKAPLIIKSAVHFQVRWSYVSFT